MKKKFNWKGLPYWSKWGIYFSIISIIMNLVGDILEQYSNSFFGGAYWYIPHLFLANLIPFLGSPYFISLGERILQILIGAIAWFVIGSVIGLIFICLQGIIFRKESK